MVLKEFAQFLKEFNVVALAIGFVMGTASTSLVKSLVDDIIMPLLSPLISVGGLQNAVLEMGTARIAYGAFLGELLSFLILALVIFLVAKKLLKMEEVPKK